MSNVRERRALVAELAWRWPLWFASSAFIGFYGVSAILEQVTRATDLWSWSLTPIEVLLVAVVGAVAATIAARTGFNPERTRGGAA